MKMNPYVSQRLKQLRLEKKHGNRQAGTQIHSGASGNASDSARAYNEALDEAIARSNAAANAIVSGYHPPTSAGASGRMIGGFDWSSWPPMTGNSSQWWQDANGHIHPHVPYGLGPFQERPKLPTEGIKVGEIVAWRMWIVRGDGWLGSYGVSRTWAPGEPMTGKVPDYGDEGIWAFKDKSRALGKAISSASCPARTVYGSVKLWGKVVEHEIGYRAEYAKVVSLEDTFPSDNKMLAVLRERYGC